MPSGWLDEEWHEDLLWCPSQCYRRYKHNDKIYTLYLRWRYDDPWMFRIAEGDMLEDRGLYLIDIKTGKAEVLEIDEKGEMKTRPIRWKFITGDIFEAENLFFRDYQLKEAEKKAEELFLKMLDSLILGNLVKDDEKKMAKKQFEHAPSSSWLFMGGGSDVDTNPARSRSSDISATICTFDKDLRIKE